MLNHREGTTMILTTHYIEEADYLCNRVAIMDHGKIMAIDTPNKLKQAVGVNLISLRIANGDDGIVNSLRELSWVRKVEAHAGTVELNIDGGDERLPELIDFADENGFAISSIDLRQPSLEDAFLYYTGREIREEEGNLMELWKGVMRRKRGRK
ncbi:Linearmycin resistance ATP-binding protein LnrL [subsurface metagenome]